MNLDKIKEIFEAWKISFRPDDTQAELASKRIEICNSCEFKVETPVGPGISFFRCSVCGCALKAKVYTTHTHLNEGGSCPKGFWSTIEDDYFKKKNE
jgi:hypothetical protein